MSAANDIPHDNPILSAIESWKERTPLLTRYLLTSQVISYAASWFIDGTLALSNIPHFTLIKFEIYRLFSSLLVNTSVFSILFAVMSVGEFSKRLEYSMGSAAFGWLCFLLGLGSNTMFLLITWLLSYLDPTWMLASASGMWMIYYGVLAVACAQAPAELRIRLCVVQVPVMYFPLALLVLMSIMGGGGHSLGNLTSLLLGYAVGNGYLGAVQLSSARAKHWEDSVLASLTQRDGWVYGHAATGSEGGWKDTEDGAMLLPLFRGTASQQDGAPQVRDEHNARRNVVMLGDLNAATRATTADSHAPSVGRKLGGASRRSHADPRAARLQALERKNLPADP